MPMTVHMYHPLRQPELPNHCIPVNGECSHFCVPAPRITENSAKTSCVCPMDLELDADHKTCVRTTIEGNYIRYFVREVLITVYYYYGQL